MTELLILGCGYLGQYLAGQWLAAGGRVWASTRSRERGDSLRQQGVEPVVADILRPESLGTLPETAHVVFCVGVDRDSGQSLSDIHERGLGNVLAELGRPGRTRPRRLLYVSSSSVYGQTDGSKVDETAATEPVEEGGQVMRAAEHLLRERWPEGVVFRFAGIYGPGRLIGARGLQAGTPVAGDPQRWLNLIQVEDGAAAVRAALERGGVGETYNVCDDRPVRRGEFYTLLAKLLGAAPPRFEPGPPDAPAAAHGLTNRRLSNRRLREELGVQLRYPSCEEGLPASLGPASPFRRPSGPSESRG